MSVLLGFDYGRKFIGVAVGQTVSQTANPLTTLTTKTTEPDWQKVAELIQAWDAQGLVVGIPLNVDGSDQSMTHHARYFANQLQKRFQLPVYKVDERFTTKEARQQLFEQGGYKALSKEQVDSFSAKLILETWLVENS